MLYLRNFIDAGHLNIVQLSGEKYQYVYHKF